MNAARDEDLLDFEEAVDDEEIMESGDAGGGGRQATTAASLSAIEAGERDIDEKEEGELIAPPYEYPTGVVRLEQLDLHPMNNAYKLWTATPGVPDKPWQDDLTVGLAHKRGGKKGGMYQLIIGNRGNLQVDHEKHQGRKVDTVASSAGLLCAANQAHKYWVAVKNGRLDFGVGDDCGQHTVLSHQDEGAPIEVRYVGFTCLRHRALFTDIRMEAVVDGPLRPAVETDLEFVRAEGCDEGFSGEDKAALDTALEQYQRECDAMKRRARKFGGTYTPPFLQDWVPWTLVKRLSWNRDSAGGINPESREEREKRRMRAERFGQGEQGPAESAAEALKIPLAARADPDLVEMITEEKRFARSQKFSIPDMMWKAQAEEQGLRPADIFCKDSDRADPEPMAKTFPHKIHIFSFDKTVCTQIRDNDVKAYFQGYGPKYVEWLSDWSFNVVFGDPDEARNAAAARSFGLPERLPQDIAEEIREEAVLDMGAMGWRLGVPMCKVMRDRWGPKGQWVRLLLRCAEEQDFLLERPQTPAKPQGPIVQRAGGNRLPPAIRAAQGVDGGRAKEEMPRRRGEGRVGKRHRRDEENEGRGDVDAIMGQALKARRTTGRRKDVGERRDEPHSDDHFGERNHDERSGNGHAQTVAEESRGVDESREEMTAADTSTSDGAPVGESSALPMSTEAEQRA